MPEIKKQQHVELFVKFLYPGIILRGDAFTFDGEKIWDGNKPLSDKIIKNLIDRKIRKIYYKRISLAGKGKVKDPMIDKKIIDKAVNIAHELEYAITKKSIIPEAAVGEIVDNFIDGISTSEGTTLNLLELKEYDDYTYTHSINVCLIAILFAKKLSYNPKGLKVIGVAALLHDIGKLMVPIDILQKPGPLTSDEFDIVKKHPVFGYELIKSESGFGSLIQKAVLLHHEKYSGNGYPLGLRGERISQIAQIISLADVFDAITSEHPYKPSRPYWYALSQIKKEVGRKSFFAAFCSNFRARYA